MRIVGVLIAAVLFMGSGLLSSPANALTVEAPFDDTYTAFDLGSVPGVPAQYGGLTLLAGDADTLLIGGEANAASGALYSIAVTRDGNGHITGFSGTATRVIDAAFNDGGVVYGPGGVLFLARWPVNELGQTKPGSVITDKVIDVGSLGVAGSLSSIAFVPDGYPGAGAMKLVTYSGGSWYTAGLSPDGSGTYDLVNLNAVPSSNLPGGPEGITFVPLGSVGFSAPSILVSEFSAGAVAAYELDSNGDPIVATRRTFISDLGGAEGAFTDPVTGDFLFSTFGGGSRVIAVQGFASPTTTVPDTTTTTVPDTTTTTTVPDTTTTTVPDTTTTTTVPDTTTTTVPDTTTTTVPDTTTTTVPDTTTTTVPDTTTTTVDDTTTTTVPPVEDPCANPTITGTEGDDTIFGTTGDDVIAGLGGRDFIVGAGGSDTICGGSGNDSISGDAGSDDLFGGEGSDKLRGGSGNDTSDGGAGNDTITDGGGDDTLIGAEGRDTLQGGEGNDSLDGGGRGDSLDGGGGDDSLDGGGGSDQLDGGDGTDECDGGGGGGNAVNCESPQP